MTKHLLEEAYEAVDALDVFVAMEERGEQDDDLIAHVEEELGDVLVQVVLHAELGEEEGNFNFASIVDTLRDKLIHRHPHVFGDLAANSADEVAARWEVLKRKEKGRDSVLDGVAWQMPALTLTRSCCAKPRWPTSPSRPRSPRSPLRSRRSLR